MKAYRVAVFEDDAGRVSHWCALLDILGYTADVIAPESVFGAPPPRDPGWLALLVGRVTRGRPHAEALQAVMSAHSALPLVFADGRGCWQELAERAARAGTQCWNLEQPVPGWRVADVLHRARLLRAQQQLASAPGTTFGPGGHSAAIARVRRLVEQVAPYDTTVLITGESGTGKERVARYLHELSGRAARAFVPVNCGAIPTDLLESELFGHEKGAFTGAVSARVGRFELAEGGTIFLDEIGDMSLPMQVKLLRVLQERTYERVGSSATRACNVRIVAATHRNLEQLIERGQFREDLYYRLHVFPIEVPPLRERIEDLPDLITALSREIERNRGVPVCFAPSAVRALGRLPWPGNVRELENLIERIAILCPDRPVETDDLPDRYRVAAEATATQVPLGELPQEGIDLRDCLAAAEVRMIRLALREANGTIAQAARLLRLQRTTLVEKLRKYQIAVADEANDTSTPAPTGI